jgi:predicted acylesterase/phospholipase RssA
MASPSYHRLVLSGGELKGCMYIGLFKMLEQRPDLLVAPPTTTDESNDTRIELVGVSSGAIFLSLLTLGMAAHDMETLCLSFSISEISNVTYKSLLSIFSTFGVDSGDRFKEKLQQVISQILGPDKKDITLKEVYDLPNQKYNLTLVTSNLSLQRIEYLSAETEPDMPLWKAIMMSCCFALYFSAIPHKGCIYVDGGVCDNIPIFDDNVPTLAILLEKKDGLCSSSSSSSSSRAIANFPAFLLCVTMAMMNSIQRLGSRQHVANGRLVTLRASYDIGDILSCKHKETQIKQALIDEGYEQALQLIR